MMLAAGAARIAGSKTRSAAATDTSYLSRGSDRGLRPEIVIKGVRPQHHSFGSALSALLKPLPKALACIGGIRRSGAMSPNHLPAAAIPGACSRALASHGALLARPALDRKARESNTQLETFAPQIPTGKAPAPQVRISSDQPGRGMTNRP